MEEEKITQDELKGLIGELKPYLLRLIAKEMALGFRESDDLYQEALINLWTHLKIGDFADKTRSYILKSCYFHLKNYIRTHKVGGRLLSLDEPLASSDDESLCLGDIIEDDSSSVNKLYSYMVVDEIMNSGLSPREKEVFRLLYEGLTLREIAGKLNISYVRVLKIKQNISAKYWDRVI